MHQASDMLELNERLDRKLANLFGGQQQRVTMDRADPVRHRRYFLVRRTAVQFEHQVV